MVAIMCATLFNDIHFLITVDEILQQRNLREYLMYLILQLSILRNLGLFICLALTKDINEHSKKEKKHTKVKGLLGSNVSIQLIRSNLARTQVK